MKRFDELPPYAVFRWKGRVLKRDGHRAWAYPFQNTKYPFFFNGGELVEEMESPETDGEYIQWLPTLSAWSLSIEDYESYPY